MYQESILQELFDSILRSLSVAGFLVVVMHLLQPRIERRGRIWANFVYGGFCGLLSLATIALPLPVAVGHTIDLRILPLMFAAPLAGIPASMLAVAMAVLGEFLLSGTIQAPGLVAILMSALVGGAVAWAMGWPLGTNGEGQPLLRTRHVLVLAVGAVVAALLPEAQIFMPTVHQHTDIRAVWLLHLILLPGAIGIMGGFIIELSRRRRMERAMRIETERTATIAANIPGVLYQRSIGPQGNLIFRYMSARAFDVFGLDPAAIVADASVFLSRVHPDDRALVFATLEKAARSTAEPIVCEFRITRPDGRMIWIQTRSQINQEASAHLGEAVAEGMAIDITDRKKAEAEAQEARDQVLWATEHDTLTQLLNRQGLQLLGAELDARGAGQSGLFLALSLRNSYLVNELFGTAGGDLRLIEVAQRLTNAIAADGVVARTGDDEFAVYVYDPPGSEEAQSLVERIVRAVDQPLRLSGQLVPMRVDVGYVIRDASVDDWENVVQAALTALEEARSRDDAAIIAFTPRLKAERMAQRALDLRLADAVEHGELVVFWQPIVAASDRHMLGREALVRWVQADGSFVLPSSFIPRAEATGLWPKLDGYVLHNAARLGAGWNNDLWISVNMSPGWLIVGDLVGEVRSALDASGLAAQRLCIEVTERALVEDHARAAKQIERLREMGVAVAIDDFGSGYSSLSYLNRLPISKVKIDKSFIDDIEISPRARDIVKNIIDLCQKISVESIAEGVETERQWEWLRANGCCAMQGYLVGQPEQL